MPTIDASLKDLSKLIGKPITASQLEDLILYAKGELDGVEGDNVKLDMKDTNRPDLWSAEGVAREIALRFGKKKTYAAKKSNIKIVVEKGMENIRPYVAGFAVKNIKITEELLKQMIYLQEKTDTTFGRKRKEVATGIYDLDKVQGDIRYYPSGPEKKFIPLGFEKEMTIKQILKEHPKGKDYGHLLPGPKYPVFEDSNGNVLSMTPVINSNHTGKVTEETKNLLVECSGFNKDWLMTTMNLFAAAFADRGGEIQSIEIHYPDGAKITTPDFTPKKAKVSMDYVRKLLGQEITDQEIHKLLEKSGYEIKSKGATCIVLYPSYRQDIMHQADIAEDIIISLDFNKIKPNPYRLATIGGQSQITHLSDAVAEIMVGAGLQEILSYTLTSKPNLFQKMNLPEIQIAEIENPISSNWAVLRNQILPSLLEFLSKNKNQEYPQKIFEIGECVEMDSTKDVKTRSPVKIAVAISDSSVNYAQISAIANSLLSTLGIKFSLKTKTYSSFLPGRCASISVGGKEIGILGEIHPQVLNNWQLEKPTLAMELYLEPLLKN